MHYVNNACKLLLMLCVNIVHISNVLSVQRRLLTLFILYFAAVVIAHNCQVLVNWSLLADLIKEFDQLSD